MWTVDVLGLKEMELTHLSRKPSLCFSFHNSRSTMVLLNKNGIPSLAFPLFL